jgi:Leucine-rich repeat (LRR) protein
MGSSQSFCQINKLVNLQSDTIYNVKNCTNTEINLGNETAGAFWTSVQASNNQISRISDATFKWAKKLTHIDLRENKIEQISVGAFKDQGKLEGLYLKQNKLTRIEVGTFDSLTELKDLWLQNNQLSLIEKGLFDKNWKLEKLFMDENKIAVIEPTAFEKLNSIKSLTLKNNLCIDQDFNSNHFHFENCAKHCESLIKSHLDQIRQLKLEKRSCDDEKLVCLTQKGILNSTMRTFSENTNVDNGVTEIFSNFWIIAGIVGLVILLIALLISIVKNYQLSKKTQFLSAKLDKLCVDNIYEIVDY